MYRIRGYLQNYPWGISGGLRSWLGNADRATLDPSEAEAELWYGSHQNGPSPIVGGRGATLRDEVDPPRVPLLVKLLAAARPLSIQVHPPLAQAIAGFGAQQRDHKLPRLLSDSAAKTEMLIAIKPFSALQGWREFGLAAQILAGVGGSASDAAVELRAGAIKQAIAMLLAIPRAELDSLNGKVPAAAAAAELGPAAIAALATVAANYPSDPGVLVAVLLDHCSLVPGEAVFLPAGVVHAYVTGTGLEVMTASDNVLRLGLTNKVVAVDAALAALRLDLRPQRLEPPSVALPDGGHVREYEPEGGPFRVTAMTEGAVEFAEPSYRLVLSVVGQATVSVAGRDVTLNAGEAAAVLDDDGPMIVAAGAATFVARPQLPFEPPRSQSVDHPAS